jgi:hypothetical protein
MRRRCQAVLIQFNMGYEYPLRQGCLDEITAGGLATSGLTLKEYDDLLFGAMLPDPDKPVDTSLGDTVQERRAARKRIEAGRPTTSPANSGSARWEQRADGVWRRPTETSSNGQAGNANGIPYSDPLNARFKEAGGTPFGNDPMGTGFSPGPKQEKENSILASPVQKTGNDLTNI